MLQNGISDAMLPKLIGQPILVIIIFVNSKCLKKK